MRDLTWHFRLCLASIGLRCTTTPFFVFFFSCPALFTTRAPYRFFFVFFFVCAAVFLSHHMGLDWHVSGLFWCNVHDCPARQDRRASPTSERAGRPMRTRSVVMRAVVVLFFFWFIFWVRWLRDAWG